MDRLEEEQISKEKENDNSPERSSELWCLQKAPIARIRLSLRPSKIKCQVPHWGYRTPGGPGHREIRYGTVLLPTCTRRSCCGHWACGEWTYALLREIDNFTVLCILDVRMMESANSSLEFEVVLIQSRADARITNRNSFAPERSGNVFFGHSTVQPSLKTSFLLVCRPWRYCSESQINKQENENTTRP